MTAGTNGLSLSTAINLRTQDPNEMWSFNRIFLDNSAVGDGIPDFLAVDLAQGRSSDSWQLLDDMGVVLASVTVTSSAWSVLGIQDVSRVDFTTGNVNNFNGRELAGLALELSDFEKVGGGNLSSADVSILDNIASLAIDVAENGGNPRTDYAFIASNTNSIKFEEQIPEPTSMLFLLLGAMTCLSRRR